MIIQGFRDVLFPFNEGVKAAKCIKNAQKDVHLIGVEGGHLQPFAQSSPSGQTPFWYIGKTVQCGNKQKYNLQDTILAWLNHQLKDRSEKPNLDELCVDNSPVRSLQDLMANTAYTITPTKITATKTQAVFVPIQIAEHAQYITGNPLLKLKVEAEESTSPTLFISLAIKSKQTGKYQIVNEQTTPFNLDKKHQYDQIVLGSAQHGVTQDIELSSINTRLEVGDTLGLFINTESIYYKRIKQPKFEVGISGEIILPKLWSIENSVQ